MLNKFKKKIEKQAILSDKEWDAIKDICEVVQIKKKDVLIKYGSLCKDAFFLAEGSLEMSLILQQGDTKTVWFFLDEIFNMFGAADSLLLNEKTKYEITALEDSVVLKFDFEKFRDLACKYLSISAFMREEMMYDFMISHEIRNHMTSHSSVDFLLYLDKNFGTILKRIPDKNIAQFMGITPEWYSKLRRKLNDLS